ncbi:MAG TPA: ABC transporter substrate-binding protein [Bacteroidia bacterium]|jgi:oligopeptide transport system substrate-binding protein|nr:ABC transporter substrate-binding protein [Bacteroidia bacterium]
MKIKHLLIAAGFTALMLSSCGGDKDKHLTSEAKGGVFYGGVFRMNELEDFKNLYPLSIIDVISQRIANQVYEGMVKLSQADLSVIPALAYRWETNTDASVWTFHLRKGVKFHDDACFADGKGRELTGGDVKFCFDKLCEASSNNNAYDITFKDRVVGASEYFEKSKSGKGPEGGVPGIKALNDSTVEISLTSPFSGFLNILAHTGCYIYPKEALDKYGIDMRTKCVGTGPFQVKTIKEGETVILEKNPNYWNIDEFGNRLPYLDAIKFTFIKEKKAEMLEFQRGNLDMVYRIPIEMYKEIMGSYDNAKARQNDFEIQNVPALSCQYYGMLNTGGVFNKKEVRLAFNYAIDRNKIVDYILQGEGEPGIYGVVPPVEAFKKGGFDFSVLKGYSLDVAKAKELMKQAGYPDGKGFPKVTLTINAAGNERNGQIAETIQTMLKDNLGVDVSINVMPFAEEIDAYQSGKLDFFRTGWIADYPDPETFLTLFYSKHIPANAGEKSFINTCRFTNARFDSLFKAALKEPDLTKRMNMYMQADQIIINEGAFMPIFYDENDRLVQKNVRNFPANAMEYRDLTRVYIVPKEKANGTDKK